MECIKASNCIKSCYRLWFRWIYVAFGIIFSALLTDFLLVFLYPGATINDSNNSFQDKLIIGLGAVFIPLLVAILTKEQKLSEFRQQWIDGLRDSISGLISNCRSFHYNKPVPGSATPPIFDLKGVQDIAAKSSLENYLNQMDKFEALIKLRLNPNGKDYNNLLDKMKEFVKYSRYQSRGNSNQEDLFESHHESFMRESQKVLKNEWAFVKKGESLFDFVKMGSFGMALGILMFSFQLHSVRHMKIFDYFQSVKSIYCPGSSAKD